MNAHPIPALPAPELPIDTRIVHHRRLNIERDGSGLRFKIETVTGHQYDDSVEDYAKRVADRETYGFGGFFKKFAKAPIDTPFDIKLGKERCYVLIELHKEIDWAFTPGSYGISMKTMLDAHRGHDYGLRFAMPKVGTTPAYVTKPGEAMPVGCRVAFWAITKRNRYEERGFNFHVTFHQVSDGNHHWLPTVFDPNVPNSGGDGIPS
jgi:hypothetical protein